MKWVWRIAAAGLAIATIGFVAGFLWLRTSLPQTTGEIRLAGLAAPVRVARTRDGVPLIRAGSERDAYFGLGFVHAQDRLWQMESMRRLGAGRLSEIVGKATVPIDRAMRILGLYRYAEQSLEHLAPHTIAALEAYAAGVNAYLFTRPGALPPEFELLRARPEPWRPADSLVWGRLMVLQLTGNWRREVVRAQLATRLTRKQLEEIWPELRGHKAPLPTAARAVSPEPEIRWSGGGLFDALAPYHASNSWAVHGRHTASGKPILANDPHLGFRAPIMWYLARLQAPGIDLAGATVPGVPFTILGQNGRIAWSFTTTGSDTQDLYVERLDPADPDNKYLTPAGPLPFETRTETIRVRGGADVVVTVRSTRHGPVVSDGDTDMTARLVPPGHVVALRSTIDRADDLTAEAIFDLNRAGSWDEFLAAMKKFHAPQQNIIYADADGNIGFVAPARVPIRRNGIGAMPVPGWTDEYEWTGFVPFDELPRSLNPPGGTIANANDRIVDGEYPHYLGDGWAPPYRVDRIRQRLAEHNPHSVETAAEIQADVVSLMARQMLPLLTAVAPAGDRERRAVTLLRSWEGAMTGDGAEPLIFTAWIEDVARNVFGDEFGPAFGGFRGLAPEFLHRILTERHHWCDDIGTQDRQETCPDRISVALTEALDRLTKRYGADMSAWRWDIAHKARFDHAVFGRVPVLRDFSDIVVPAPGDTHTVNVASIRVGGAEPVYEGVHGPGYRVVHDLADPERSRYMIATGQSGNPLSPHYADMVERWRDVTYVPVPASEREIVHNGGRLLMLLPKEEP